MPGSRRSSPELGISRYTGKGGLDGELSQLVSDGQFGRRGILDAMKVN